MTRRDLLLMSTAAAGSGILFAAWPIVRQMSPDASTRAHRSTTIVNLVDLVPDNPKVVEWQRMPVHVLLRSPSTIVALRNAQSGLRDPISAKRQQPSYATNWHRSLSPQIGAFIGVCTHCRCKTEAGNSVGIQAAFVCPCCASRYDGAGRAYDGPADYNLPVPPYAIVSKSQIEIGANPPGQNFNISDVERL